VTKIELHFGNWKLKSHSECRLKKNMHNIYNSTGCIRVNFKQISWQRFRVQDGRLSTADERRDLTAFDWETTPPLLQDKQIGVPPVVDRPVLNGNFFIPRSGYPLVNLADLPERHGSCPTYVNRFSRWRKVGVLHKLTNAIIGACGSRVRMIDSTAVWVHEKSAAQKKCGDTCVDRNRVGLTIEIRLRVNSLPEQLEMSLEQMHNGSMVEFLPQDLLHRLLFRQNRNSREDFPHSKLMSESPISSSATSTSTNGSGPSPRVTTGVHQPTWPSQNRRHPTVAQVLCFRDLGRYAHADRSGSCQANL
jgi:transposase